MSEQTTAFRKVFEYELLAAECAVKHYRSLLGMPPVGSSTDCAKEIESLKSQLQGKTEENGVLYRKVHDLIHKLCQSRREYIKLCNELKTAKKKLSVYHSEQDEVRAKAALYDEIVADASDCLVGEVLGIKHEPNDLEPDGMFYFLRITKDEAYRIDMGGYAHLEIWED